ncbi:DUF5694 domain-containing protein [Constantimarinum furrinae]|uniref:Uncharacterized protein n=1 Tax=Constantimarinum furrinae TaxID=2562285 RepID=A0A7G8PQQ6_9FLAO|nr:DUF5694 domain-containing protein [Constantimarinum furrinae]QNJ96672.1 hypothetical protein ALE3EI_0081 [Constantimarinum furrinae]
MKYFFLSFIVFTLTGCSEKKAEVHNSTTESTSAERQQLIEAPSSFFPEEKAKVLVVGTFHMNYPGLDAHKTTPEDQIDVLKEPKKSEIDELVAYIKKFNPTKIALEANPNWETMEKYRKYREGEFGEERDERFQLGMRIAMELDLDTLYAVNSYSLKRDMYVQDSVALEKLVGNIDWKREDRYWDYVQNWFDYEDKLPSRVNLLDYFKHMNSRESHNYGYGLYLLGNFKSENNQGADNLSIWWYNRNLRIFRNIQGITESPEDRILVIMGNGHAAILRQLFETSPEYEFVEFDSLD